MRDNKVQKVTSPDTNNICYHHCQNRLDLGTCNLIHGQFRWSRIVRNKDKSKTPFSQLSILPRPSITLLPSHPFYFLCCPPRQSRGVGTGLTAPLCCSFLLTPCPALGLPKLTETHCVQHRADTSFISQMPPTQPLCYQTLPPTSNIIIS